MPNRIWPQRARLPRVLSSLRSRSSCSFNVLSSCSRRSSDCQADLKSSSSIVVSMAWFSEIRRGCAVSGFRLQDLGDLALVRGVGIHWFTGAAFAPLATMIRASARNLTPRQQESSTGHRAEGRCWIKPRGSAASA
ncbi:hypothetical protein NB693_23405 [Pantoea ananatis]|uniref:hypothetical protein n=1 Tax=Pantoea ananas TaxID=553 RepID=UPI00221F6241|nr:hypothetical protein [Pantoea ananatis]